MPQKQIYVELIEEVLLKQPRELVIPKGFQGCLIGEDKDKRAIVYFNVM